MTDAATPSGGFPVTEPAPTEHQPSVQELKAEIEKTREDLGKTVEALAAKADVKARAQDKVDELKERASNVTADDARQAAGSAAGQAVGYVRSQPAVAAGVGALFLLLILRRRRRRNKS